MYYEEKTTKKLARAIRYLADSDACTRVQFRRDPEMCKRYAVDGCEACWNEELGEGNCEQMTTDASGAGNPAKSNTQGASKR